MVLDERKSFLTGQVYALVQAASVDAVFSIPWRECSLFALPVCLEFVFRSYVEIC